MTTPETVTSFKLALSNDQCGALIGKGGAVISSLQKNFNVVVKAGGAGEYSRLVRQRAAS